MRRIVMNLVRTDFSAILLFLSLSLAISGCSTAGGPPAKLPLLEQTSTGLRIEQGAASQGSEPRRTPIQALILHHTAGSLASSYDVLQGRKSDHRVGIHYLVTDEAKPRVIAMVPESKAAFHAGKSAWRQFDSLNQPSIGIEIINLDGNVHPYTPAQKEVIANLCADILRRNPGIAPTEVLAHSDVAVGRKVDPGLLFPWAELAARNVGAWPSPADVAAFTKSAPTADPAELRRLLLTYGYAVEPGEGGLKLAVESFQRHFRPRKVDGIADAETVATLRALVKRYRTGPTAPAPSPVLPAAVRPAKVGKTGKVKP
jgi:N-acetyl-anhydromuramyl-L-alanine amidase AmpD